MKSGSLPTKTCQVCGKPMSWRKKWGKNWEEVRYCSQRCRTQKQQASKNTTSKQAASAQ